MIEMLYARRQKGTGNMTVRPKIRAAATGKCIHHQPGVAKVSEAVDKIREHL
jgi:hypothetical protein